MENILSAIIFCFVTLFTFDVAFFAVSNITKIFRTSVTGGSAFKFFKRK